MVPYLLPPFERAAFLPCLYFGKVMEALERVRFFSIRPLLAGAEVLESMSMPKKGFSHILGQMCVNHQCDLSRLTDSIDV